MRYKIGDKIGDKIVLKTCKTLQKEDPNLDPTFIKWMGNFEKKNPDRVVKINQIENYYKDYYIKECHWSWHERDIEGLYTGPSDPIKSRFEILDIR